MGAMGQMGQKCDGSNPPSHLSVYSDKKNKIK